jgi:5-oxopent-3-ene-1,2,5-tricarboxylate decarboxylase/2-hydroxyhepta-2,4-diene-1,7-dioate isomerase
MKLCTFKPRGAERTVGLVLDDQVLDLAAAAAAYGRKVNRPVAMPRTMLGWIEAGLVRPAHLKRLARFAEESRALNAARLPLKAVRLLAPIPRPPMVFALGLNYAAHAAESGSKPPEEPIVFGKASTSIIGPGDPVVIKPWLGRVDPEVELAVIIGKGGSEIPEARAMEHVAGYSILNDVTARAMQRADLGRSQPWLRSKGIDTFGPFGPWVVTPDEVPDPHALHVELRVNGEVRQSASTSEMIFHVPQIIAFISRHMRIEPGAIISTGTPSGIAPIAPGDSMECTISGIGTLQNPVVAA